jgi:hypothetical protein
MLTRLPKAALATLLAAPLAACHTVASDAARPAVLADGLPDGNAQTIATITEVLGKVTGQGRVKLGPGDPTKESLITVLPPPPGPYEGNSPAMPTYFELVTDGKACYLRERDRATLHPLPGVVCRAK